MVKVAFLNMSSNNQDAAYITLKVDKQHTTSSPRLPTPAVTADECMVLDTMTDTCRENICGKGKYVFSNELNRTIIAKDLIRQQFVDMINRTTSKKLKKKETSAPKNSRYGK